MSPRLPAGVGTLAATLLAGLGTVALAGVGWIPTLFGLIGVGCLAAAYLVGASGLATVGGLSLYVTVLVAAVAGLDPASVLVGGVGSFLAWTFGRTAAGLRGDLGDASSGSLELLHVAGTTTLATTGAIVTYVPFYVGRVDVPPLGLAAFIVGAVLLASSLREY